MFTEPYISNVTIFAGTFAPAGWAFCNGQLMSIAQYTALFSLIGTTFGGDGQNTFALPDLRSRKAIHPGTFPGGANYFLGQVGGNESVTLNVLNLPQHSHIPVGAGIAGGPTASTATALVTDPTNAVPAALPNSVLAYATATSGATMGATTATSQTPIAGNSQPISLIDPYLAMNYIIAIEGIFPSRN